jgi:hypothetical protein
MDAGRRVRTNSDAVKKTHRYNSVLHLHLEAVYKSVIAEMDVTAQLGGSSCPN